MIGYNVRDYDRVFRHFIDERKNDLKIGKVLLFWCLNDLYTNHDAVEMPGGKIRLRIGKILNRLRVHSRFYYFLKTILFDRPKSYYLFDSRLYREERQKVADGINRLRDIRRRCGEQGIGFTVVLLPYEYQIRSRESAPNEPQRIMMREMDSSGIDAWDALPYLKASGVDSGKLYLTGDGIHLSATGHRIVADFLWRHFRQGRRENGLQKQFDFKPSVL